MKSGKLSPRYLALEFQRRLRQEVTCGTANESQLSLAAALGVFMGIVPLWGLQSVTVLILAHVLRLNKAIAYAFSNISIPPMIPLILFASLQLGALFWQGTWLPLLPEQVTWEFCRRSLGCYLAGSIILATSCAAITYLVCWTILRLWRRSCRLLIGKYEMKNNTETARECTHVNLPAANWDGRAYGTPLGYRLFVVMLRGLGLRAAYCLLIFVVLYYYCFRPKSRRSSTTFRKIFNSWPGAKFQLRPGFALLRVYRFGQTIVDRLAVFSDSDIDFRLEHQGIDYLNEIGRDGGILLGAHIGNWEIGLMQLKREFEFRPAVAMLQVAGDPMQRWLHNASQDFLTVVALSQDNQSNTLLLKQQLDAGKLVALHGDRFFGNMRTLSYDFLGRPARFPIGPYILAATLEKPLCFVHVVKIATNCYRLVCSPPHHYRWDSSCDRQQQLRQWIGEYVAFLEAQVGQYPEQWFNFYNFWR